MPRSSRSTGLDDFRTVLATGAGLCNRLERALDVNVNWVNPSDPGGRLWSKGRALY